MPPAWSVAQIESLTDDPGSLRDGKKLATAAKWSSLGVSEEASRGLCQGNSRGSYRTAVDLSDPAFKCSCPSRKFPCKHGIALFLLYAGQPVLLGAGEAPSGRPGARDRWAVLGQRLEIDSRLKKRRIWLQGLVQRPAETVLVLIRDLYEGGNSQEMLKRVAALVSSGVTMVTLLALNDEGKPSYDARHAAAFATLGAPAFACPPDLFPELMAAAISRRDLRQWIAANGG